MRKGETESGGWGGGAGFSLSFTAADVLPLILRTDARFPQTTSQEFVLLTSHSHSSERGDVTGFLVAFF